MGRIVLFVSSCCRERGASKIGERVAWASGVSIWRKQTIEVEGAY